MPPAVSRRIALAVLDALDDSGATPDSLLSRAFEKDRRPARRDRALANELVLGVLRWRGRLDWTIDQLSSKPLQKLDPQVLNVIRLGLYQILFLTRIPESAAVNESVELAKTKGPEWVVGFVNAVLRSAVRKAKHMRLPDDADDSVTAIAVRESHPPWMVKRWVERMGADETARLCEANNRIPPVTVRTNTLRTSRHRLASALSDCVEEIGLTRFAPDGIALRGMRRAISEIPEFQDGWFQVQDEAAQIVSCVLNPRPGETVLDACAGFGGKTGHLAQLMVDSGKITAVDHNSWKLSELKASMARLGVSCVTTWHHDWAGGAADNLCGGFDRILLDAPCSGLGVLRRNPDIKWNKDEQDLRRLQGEQKRLLACVAPLVKRDGILVYCVCSLEPEEGQHVIEDFLKKHDDFVMDRTPSGLSGVDELLMDSSGYFVTRPHEHETDGFFAVRLKKTAA